MVATAVVPKTQLIEVEFNSQWDGGITLTSRALYNPETHEVIVFDASNLDRLLDTYNVDGLEAPEREYITLPYGIDYEVARGDDGRLLAVPAFGM